MLTTASEAGGSRVSRSTMAAGSCIAFIALIPATWWVSVHQRSADPLVPLRTAQPWLLALSGLASSLGAGPVRAAALAVALAALAVARQWEKASYVLLVTGLAHIAERVMKATVSRSRPGNPLDGHALAVSIRMMLIVAILVVGVALLRRQAFLAAALVGAAYLVVTVLYNLASVIQVGTGTDSYPSGHATNTMAIIVALILVRPPGRRWNIGAALGLAFVASVGVSRVTLGYHHPLDVAAGWLLGIGVAFGCRALVPAGAAVIDSANVSANDSANETTTASA